ncbi:hypothetical protein PPYR_01292 [Photinus pyralis]|uniref:Isoleucine--tRNA ligase, cytoplasmic n=4 Tax=Photinus pyralis TaxID=7054 RepID=A0A5N4B402_PHOPY|nr:isoleucine--tRNA ligase, cytoplasmic-like [Photinus pyralis]KAB0804322.1 hypothetical protein PPYR_01292 [Photinus pyralis]
MELSSVPETINFAEEEVSILDYWNDIDAFKTSLKQSKGKPKYSFYDGPPFATGLPHYGHILTGTVKDIVTRYAHQRGYYVERRFGWDCHGLPIEMEVDKMLGIKGPQDVHKLGISSYNQMCRAMVTKYAKEWKIIMGRIGRWIDFDHDYKTMYPWYMETVWWVFKQLYLKGLVYHGTKIMPYSTVCATPLSNFESGQNYKTVTDPAVTVSLPIVGDTENAAFLIWTTTPWTLPSNLAICVNPHLLYARVREISTGEVYVLLKARLKTVFKLEDYEVLEIFYGKELRGVAYEPVFSYYERLKSKGAFRVLTDDYVTEEFGTGIVHQAPYFGEDDYRICLQAGIISVEDEPICPIDVKGRFTMPITEFKGKYFKDADPSIIELLKEKKRLVRLSHIQHSYPFCWRSDTPLIYKAVPSWFIRVEHLSKLLQEHNSKTHWVPEFVKEKRFGNWLKEARDWAVSRNRCWGTPIPIWMSESGGEIQCVGSISELKRLTGTKIEDLHRENIDHLTIPSKTPGNPPLRRIPEVFDCWFESGSMPYAQKHFPFENVSDFFDSFPVDFIAEGIDQTRGWFYTLLVIATNLFGVAPFKNVIATGLVLASDGQKMSKRKNNYPDPVQIISKYGADALRLYLINSPVVRAENLFFKEDGVRDMVKYVLLPWFNAYRFLVQNVEMFACQTSVTFKFEDAAVDATNIMDLWVLSLTQTLLKQVEEEMTSYNLYSIIPRVIKYFENLTNWYLRMNRSRLKGETDKEDYMRALLTLFSVTLTMTKALAPFAPFFSEYVYQNLRKWCASGNESVHFSMYPKYLGMYLKSDTERSVSRMQEVVEMGRTLRDKKSLPLKYPLPELIIIPQSEVYVNDIRSLQSYISTEMNVRTITISRDKAKYGIGLQAKPDYKALGTKYKSEYKAISKAIESLTDAEINDLFTNRQFNKDGQCIDTSLVRFVYKTDVSVSKQYELGVHNEVIVLLDVRPTSDMLEEGTAREIVNRIQRLRKKSHLSPMDKVKVYYKASRRYQAIAEKYLAFIENGIKTTFEPITEHNIGNNETIVIDHQSSKDGILQIILVSPRGNILPFTKWVNVVYKDRKGLILLETAVSSLTLNELVLNVKCLFDIYEDVSLWSARGRLLQDEQMSILDGETIYVLPPNSECQMFGKEQPFCKFLNFVERGVSGTIILENPVGTKTIAEKDYSSVIRKWFKPYH